MCIFGSHTCCSHNLDVQETNICLTQFNGGWVNSLDAGLRMDGTLALDLWDMVIEVFHSSPNEPKKSKDGEQGDLLRNTSSNKHTQNQTKTPTRHDTLELCNVYFVSSNAKSSHFVQCSMSLTITKQRQ